MVVSMYCFPLARIVLDTALGGLFFFYLFSVGIQGIVAVSSAYKPLFFSFVLVIIK